MQYEHPASQDFLLCALQQNGEVLRYAAGWHSDAEAALTAVQKAGVGSGWEALEELSQELAMRRGILACGMNTYSIDRIAQQECTLLCSVEMIFKDVEGA